MGALTTVQQEALSWESDRAAIAKALKTLRDEVETELPVRAPAGWQKDAADGAASTATAEQAFAECPTARTAATIKILPSAALAGDPTNNATITVRKRDAAGTNPITLKALTTTASWTAFDAVDFGALTVSSIEAGSVLTVEITKGGTGVVVPAGKLEVRFS